MSISRYSTPPTQSPYTPLLSSYALLSSMISPPPAPPIGLDKFNTQPLQFGQSSTTVQSLYIYVYVQVTAGKL